MNGGCTRIKVRMSISLLRKCRAAAANWFSVMRLFSFSRTSGCAVSSPIATSNRPPSKSRNVDATIVHKGRMAFHNYTVEVAYTLGNRRIVLRRNCAWVKETSAVIELHRPRRRHLAQGKIDLVWNCSCRHRFRQGVAPQIAHRAVERALAIGQENGGHRLNLAARPHIPLPRNRQMVHGR